MSTLLKLANIETSEQSCCSIQKFSMNHVVGVEMIYHSDFLIQYYLFKSDKCSSEAASNEF